MPYEWTDPNHSQAKLRLWPHRSLPRRGFATAVLLAFTAGSLPLYGLLGTSLLWGLLPFVLLMVGGLWYAFERSYRSAEMGEELRRDGDQITLIHRPLKGPAKEWNCNIYWARTVLHVSGGPVPYYVTLTGNGREVEIGRFLSEDERKALHSELAHFLKQAA